MRLPAATLLAVSFLVITSAEVTRAGPEAAPGPVMMPVASAARPGGEFA